MVRLTAYERREVVMAQRDGAADRSAGMALRAPRTGETMVTRIVYIHGWMRLHERCQCWISTDRGALDFATVHGPIVERAR